MVRHTIECKGTREVAVMEVGNAGMRTRARAPAMEAASSGTAKRRRVDGGGFEPSSSLVQLRDRGRVALRPENSVSPASSESSDLSTISADRCSSSVHNPISCCSSNSNIDLENVCVQIGTPTNEFHCRESRGKMPPKEAEAESSEVKSTERPSVFGSKLIEILKMPSNHEIEEFFARAEKENQEIFKRKYNLDFEKEEPLEGRYEWVRLK